MDGCCQVNSIESDPNFLQRFKPQLIVSIHAPYGVIGFDGPSVPPSKLGHLYLDQVGIFPDSLGSYGGFHKGVSVVIVELPNSTRTPPYRDAPDVAGPADVDNREGGGAG